MANLTFTADQITSDTAPFVVDYGGTEYQLRSPAALSVDDLMAVDKTAESSILDALRLVSVDEDTQSWLAGLPWKHLQQVFDSWFRLAEVAPGESDGSETSSEPKSDD